MIPVKEQNMMDKRIDLENYNQMVRYVNMLCNLRFSQDFHVAQSMSGISVALGEVSSSASEGMDLSKYLSGYTITGNVVKMNAGMIIRGAQRITISGYSYTISETNTWVYAVIYKRVYGGYYETGTIVPANTAQYIYIPLYLFKLVRGNVELEQVAHTGAIIIPAVFE